MVWGIWRIFTLSREKWVSPRTVNG
jgi:hypothetical protein